MFCVDQKVKKIKGKTLFIESYCYTAHEWTMGFSHSTIAGGVMLWSQPPPNRKKTPRWLSLIASIFNPLHSLFGDLRYAKRSRKIWQPKDRVTIDLECEYLDRDRHTITFRYYSVKNQSVCGFRKTARSFGRFTFPKIGEYSRPVAGIRIGSRVAVGGRIVRHHLSAGCFMAPSQEVSQ